MNDTQILQQILNVTQSLQANSKTSDNVNFIPIIASIISIIPILLIIYFPTIKAGILTIITVRGLIKQMNKVTGRKVIILSHKSTGIFGSMITMEDIIKIESVIRKNKESKFDLIVNTFGGDLLASIRLAVIIKNKDIRVFVPKYAWSGGSLAAISSKELYMSETATLSPIDPQLGNFLTIFGAKQWMSVAKQKGQKAKDETIAMAETSKQIMGEMKQYLEMIIDNKNIDKEKFLNAFLEGDKSHANQFWAKDLKELGLNIQDMPFDYPDRIIEGLRKNGVTS